MREYVCLTHLAVLLSEGLLWAWGDSGLRTRVMK